MRLAVTAAKIWEISQNRYEILSRKKILNNYLSHNAHCIHLRGCEDNSKGHGSRVNIILELSKYDNFLQVEWVMGTVKCIKSIDHNQIMT